MAMTRATYNEVDAYAARWLRNLSAAGHIAQGTIDERSITQVKAEDIGTGQFHAFAGIGVWSHAARVAGWPDDFPIWTGSCPCQPFSSAGAGAGFDDARHLWPEWFRLIRQRRPAIIAGEQVASRDGLAWLDAVRADLEGEGYAVGAADLCAAGVGAPHIRQRLYFGAVRRDGLRATRDRLAHHHHHHRREELAKTRVHGEGQSGHDADGCGVGGVGVVYADAARLQGLSGAGDEMAEPRRDDAQPNGPAAAAGFWGAVAWVDCRDGKRRPTQPGLFPLADGATNRVGRLRAYGNAIVGPLAATFLRCLRDSVVQAQP